MADVITANAGQQRTRSHGSRPVFIRRQPVYKLMNRATQSGLVNAALTVAALTAVVRAGSVVKELMVAWRFGTGDELDAFLIAVLVPTAVISIIAASFSSAFIPAYIRVRQHEGVEAAQRLFQGVMGWAVVLLTLTAVLIVAGSPPYLLLIGPGFTAVKLHLTFRLLCLGVPIVLLSGIAAIWSAALNAEGRFAISAISPLATPLLIIALLWLAPSWRSLGLIAGVVCGASLEMLLLGIALKRRGFSLRPRWPYIDPNIQRLLPSTYPP